MSRTHCIDEIIRLKWKRIEKSHMNCIMRWWTNAPVFRRVECYNTFLYAQCVVALALNLKYSVFFRVFIDECWYVRFGKSCQFQAWYITNYTWMDDEQKKPHFDFHAFIFADYLACKCGLLAWTCRLFDFSKERKKCIFCERKRA